MSKKAKKSNITKKDVKKLTLNDLKKIKGGKSKVIYFMQNTDSHYYSGRS